MRPHSRYILIMMTLGIVGALLYFPLLLPVVIRAQPLRDISNTTTEKSFSPIGVAKHRKINSKPVPFEQEIGPAISITVTVTSLTTEDPSLPGRFSLSQNYPNPFNGTTIIKFALPKSTHVRLEIFNTLGQRVTILTNEFLEAGYHTIEWPGTNYNGQEVSTGIYLYYIEAGEYRKSRKMMLLK